LAPIALGRNNRLDTSIGKLPAYGVGVVALIGEYRFDPLPEHSEQWTKALYVMRLPRSQNKAERPAVSIATRMELGGEAATRPAKPLGLLIPFFYPTAQ